MTNLPPPEPQNSIPERRRRPATGVTFDEMIAIIVAFSTIGAILFWAIGGRNFRAARDFDLGGTSSLLDLNRTTDTGLGLGNILLGDTEENASLNSDLEVERQLSERLRERETPFAYVPPGQELNAPTAKSGSYQLDSGARIIPLTGFTTAPTETNFGRGRIPQETEIENENIETEPEATIPVVPVEPETTEPEPSAAAPETSEMPEDVTTDYWAYPFVKQMRDRSLIPELARNQSFEPNTLITRASMATLISQAFDMQPETENIKKFNDVTNNNVLAEDIDKAVRLGFMQGYSDNEFRPLENIPRYQVLVALATGLGLEPSQDAEQILQQFNDGDDIPEWAQQQVAAATEAGLVVNPPDVNNNSLSPNKEATKAEVAAMIHQALVQTGKLEPLQSEYIVNP